MIDRLGEALRFQGRALTLRAERQTVIAANIANADTPGYRALDFDFAKALRDASSGADSPPRLVVETPAQAAADGNGVDMDRERAKFADNALRYEAALRALNGQIRGLLDAIRG